MHPTVVSGGRIRLFRRWARPVAVVLFVASAVQACHKWVARTEPAREVLAAKAESLVRLTKADGAKQVILEPTIAGDSLIGSTPTVRRDRDRVSVALGDIRSIEVQRINRVRTALFVLGVGTAALIALVMVALSSLDLQPSSGYLSPIHVP